MAIDISTQLIGHPSDHGQEETTLKRERRFKAMFVLGIAFLAIAITQGNALYGVAVVFMVVGAAGMWKERSQ